jgi:hypothetical protein
VCAVDNCCSGLSTHPQGALQEYLDHKASITGVTSAIVVRCLRLLTWHERLSSMIDLLIGLAIGFIQHQLAAALEKRAEFDALRAACKGE